MLVEGTSGLQNPKSFYMALEFVTIYGFHMYMPSVLGIYGISKQKIKPLGEANKCLDLLI